MSSASAKRVGTKCRKSKKDTVSVPSRPFGGLGSMTAGCHSEISVLSTSPEALPLATATAGSSCNAGPSILETATPLNDSEEMEQEEIQRKHCGEKTHSLQTCSQSRMAAAAQEAASEVEPTELGRSSDEEVVDLTGESSVVDLSHNDSVVFVDETRQGQNQAFRSPLFCDSCIVCDDGDDDDDDSECRGNDVLATSELSNKLRKDRVESSRSSGSVSCPICMDGYAEIIRSGRLIVSTKCGHIFCNQCLRHSLRSASSCPTCRMKLSHKQYHPIYL